MREVSRGVEPAEEQHRLWQVMEQGGPKPKLVVVARAGYANVNTEAASEKGVAAVNGRERGKGRPTTSYALALALRTG